MAQVYTCTHARRHAYAQYKRNRKFNAPFPVGTRAPERLYVLHEASWSQEQNLNHPFPLSPLNLLTGTKYSGRPCLKSDGDGTWQGVHQSSLSSGLGLAIWVQHRGLAV